jgi:transcriptional regulator with XRE-family HTH domain
MDQQGVVLRKLRQLNGLSVKQASEKIGRSGGWLSEIENGRGSARIHSREFERIVSVYDGERYRKQFSIWIANAHKTGHGNEYEISFTGAVLKFVRIKAGYRLTAAAQSLGMGKSQLSKIEHGQCAVSNELRDRVMRFYGYSPASFKNFASEDKRAKSVPVQFKLDILLNHMSSKAIEALFSTAIQIHQQHREV